MSLSDAATAPVLAGPVPPEKQLPFLAFLRAAKENNIAAVPRFAYERPVTLGKIGLGRVLVVCDPTAVKRVLLDNVANYPKAPMERRALGATLGEGLLVSDGEKWRSHRKLMAPSFDHKSIVSYAPGMVDCVEHYLGTWEDVGAGAVVDIAEEMQKLTLRIISRAMFSTDSDGICALMGDTLKQVTKALEFRYRDAIPGIGAWNRLKRLRRMRAIFARLDASLYALIEERAANPVEGAPDLLDRLVAARDAESGVRLTNEEVRDETLIIFVAGHETTAVAMTFTWYLLSQHPKQEAKLHAELDTVLGGRGPTFEDLVNLPYTRMVIEEAMRLYPPAPGLSIRKPRSDDVLVDQKIGKHHSIVILPWVIHRHRELWDEPERFDPERFTPERSQGRPRFAYMPFGGGPRICIGASLAMTEAQLILATIAQRYRVRMVPGQDIRLQNRVTLRPKGGLKMVLVPRFLIRDTHAAAGL
jgi:cytochrome P450